MPLPASRHFERCQHARWLYCQSRYSFDESRNLSCVREYSFSLRNQELQHRYSHLSRRSLDSLSHTILTTLLTSALTTARDDGKGMESPSRLRYSGKCPFPPPTSFRAVAACSMTLPPKSLQLRRVEKSFLCSGIPGFSHQRQRCNTVIGIFLGDLSTLSHIRFFYSSIIRRLPPLEMTKKG
jgi:hypothetical protein